MDNPRRPASLLLRSLPVLALVAVGMLLGIAFGYVRAVLALAFAGVVVWLGASYFKAAGEVPPEPEGADVSDSSLRYVCSVCGLELKIEVATTDRAPTHCREKMLLVGGNQQPPLRPV